MKLNPEVKELAELYANEKMLPDSEKDRRSLILNTFSQIFPEIEKKTHTERTQLMGLWLNAHIDKYFIESEEFNQTEWKNDTIHIPIYGEVDIKPEIKYLLNIPIIRRCNGIKQLSTAYTIYPGAKHTRDEHQIGTLRVMQEFCEHLIKKQAIREDEQITLEAAALIHDVAHPPLGHSLDSIKEILIPQSPLSAHYSPEKKVDKFLLEIYLTDENSQLKKAVESINTINVNLLKSMLLENCESHDFSPAYTDLIDSEVDADRIDYLLRDSLHTGKKGDFDYSYIIKNSNFCELPMYLFSWNDDPKKDLKGLLTYLKDNHDISWAKSKDVSIKKTDDNKIIKISKENNLVEIIIDEKKKKAILSIKDGKTYDLKLKKENSELNIYDGNKKRISLGFIKDIERTLTSLLIFRKNMYEEIYECDDKVILDEVIVHTIFSLFRFYYGLYNNEITKKFLLLNDCELYEFLELFSPRSIFELYNSQLNGEPVYSLIKKYDLYEENTEFSHALKEAVVKYSRSLGFESKFIAERQFSEQVGIMSENDKNHEIPPILFSLPHYIPAEKSFEYEREAKTKRGLKDLVLINSDGSCGYFEYVSKITKEKDPSLNKFLLIGPKYLTDHDIIIEEFEKFMISELHKNDQ